MLILTRKVGESVDIGRDIKITVVRVDRNQIRLGIIAPRDMIILREELVKMDRQESPETKILQVDYERASDRLYRR